LVVSKEITEGMFPVAGVLVDSNLQKFEEALAGYNDQNIKAIISSGAHTLHHAFLQNLIWMTWDC
jgi:adenosylmethionine-8-amino-7-oxononanoate aminotransferase